MLDGIRGKASYAATYAAPAVMLFAMSCSRAPAPLAPAELPVLAPGVIERWIRQLTPQGAMHYDLRWTYVTQQGRVRGRAAVRYAPPESLRFDYRAPFGRSGAAVLVGEEVLWAEPEEEVEQLIPVAGLFWAAIGLPREPPLGARVLGREDGDTRIWQFHDGRLSQSVAYERGTPHRRLRMQLALDGVVVGAVETMLDSLGIAVSATVTFPRAATQFGIEVEKAERIARVDPEIWKRP